MKNVQKGSLCTVPGILIFWGSAAKYLPRTHQETECPTMPCQRACTDSLVDVYLLQ